MGFSRHPNYPLKKSGRIHHFLFPQQYRELPQRRLLLNVFRSIHIICFSILLGGLYYGQATETLNNWAWAALFSGVCLFLLDVYTSAVVLFEIRGLTVLIKVAMLAASLLLPADGQFNMLVVVIIFSSFVSHSPRWLRHKCLLPDRLLQQFAPQNVKARKGGSQEAGFSRSI